MTSCPVCGALEKERCLMIEPPFPSECLRTVRPPLLTVPKMHDRKCDNIRDAWEGPRVEALVGVVDQIGRLQGRAA